MCIRDRVITEMISSRLTIEPVIRELFNGIKAACNTTSKAIKTAVRVIRSILFFCSIFFTFSLFVCNYYTIIQSNHLLHLQQMKKKEEVKQ